jgi:ketosteroid isomerase-like protein
MRLPSVLSLGLLLTACAPKAPVAPAELSASELEAVKAVDAAFAAGMNAKDTAAVRALYADGARLMPPDSPILEGAAIGQTIAGLVAAGASNFALTPIATSGVGDLAYTVGTATFEIGGHSESIKYAEVLHRGSDGKWRYVVDMFSGVTPPAPAPAATK